MPSSPAVSPNTSNRELSRPSTYQYLTFPTPPPKNRGRPLRSSVRSVIRDCSACSDDGEDRNGNMWDSSIPKRQLLLLALISLVEQTALNSISPYLPEMVSKFPEVSAHDRGLAVGTLASTFALAQFATTFFWGWLSDQIGRKPVMMLGTISTATCFFAFGFCQNLWQAILIQVLMGLVNGNQGIVSSCLGEITNKSNQSRVFMYLPVIFEIGSIAGPAIGGLMVFQKNPFKKEQDNPFPYLIPNLLSASVLTVTFVLTAYFLEESIAKSEDLASMKKRVTRLVKLLYHLTLKYLNLTLFLNRFFKKSKNRDDHDDESNENVDGSEDRSLFAESLFLNSYTNSSNKRKHSSRRNFSKEMFILLGTYLIFQLSVDSYNSLYPIFASEKEPIGRNLSIKAIGLSLSFSGIVALVFQLIISEKIKQKIGNKNTYRASLFLLFIIMVLMPWVGYSNSPPLFGWGNGQVWFWIELGGLIFLKTIASVGGLMSALLLITNSSPSNSTLGTLNGLAQTLSAAGRAIGPILSGSLFSGAVSLVHWRAEFFTWMVFGGIGLLNFIASFGIQSPNRESEVRDDVTS